MVTMNACTSLFCYQHEWIPNLLELNNCTHKNTNYCSDFNTTIYALFILAHNELNFKYLITLLIVPNFLTIPPHTWNEYNKATVSKFVFKSEKSNLTFESSHKKLNNRLALQ